jgi:uncharacterized membrane-anchored protein YitT (DUF2179 family)
VWPYVRDYGLIAVGMLIQAVGLQLFLVPAQLASGGVSGLAQLINHFTGWPIGLMVLIGNIPLFAIGWRFLGGRRFTLRTLFAVATFAFFTDAVLFLPFFPRNGLTNDIVLDALYGAVLVGIGSGLVYRGQATSGGSDILARILNHWRGIPMTQSYLLTEAVVILSAGLVFGWTKALYALVSLYVSGLVVDATLEGAGTIRTAWIITSEPEVVIQKILFELQRGATILNGTGAYTGAERPVLYCVVTRSEIQHLKAIVHEADPNAFMVVGAAYEALGEGFQPFKKQ